MWTPGKRGEAFLAYTIIIILMIISKQFLQVDIWTQIDFVHVQPLNFGQNLNQLLLLEKKKKWLDSKKPDFLIEVSCCFYSLIFRLLI